MREIPKIIFEACVLSSFEEGMRYDLTEPFWRDGFLYATDARIIVRMPISLEELREGREPGDGIYLPVAPAILGPKVKPRKLPPVFTYFEEHRDLCTEPILTPFVNRWLYCSSCQRLGQRCGNCEAGGRLPDWSEVKVRGRERSIPFSAYYLGLLWEMEVHQFFVQPGAAGQNNPAMFVSTEGVEGMLMPMVPE